MGPSKGDYGAAMWNEPVENRRTELHPTPTLSLPLSGGGKSEPLARRGASWQERAARSTSPFATSRQPPPGRLRFAALRFGGHPPHRGGMERAEKNRFQLTLTASASRSQPPRRALSCRRVHAALIPPPKGEG